ncbi:MAG TPA: hypothetical protein DDX98_15060 [Bacteroidales bacterium]|jgi:hypothetical protein|nr:hypothetical protein [Bacteroidales bacterium]
MSKSKITEAILVIATALLVIYLYGVIRHEESKVIFVYLACGVGITGVLVKPLAKLIALGWYKLAEGLSFISSKIVLGAVYFIVLVPVALLYKAANKDKLGIRKSKKTVWIERNHTYSMKDLENLW